MQKHRRDTQPAAPAVARRGRAQGRPAQRPPALAQSALAQSALAPPAVPAVPRLGGYRLVRVLGEGRDAVVHLGYADDAADDEPRRTAAVKVYRQGVPPERIDAEVAALAAVAHPHLVRLVDLAETADGVPCLVLELCTEGQLGRLIADRSGLDVGEAVTVLAPLLAAVESLHRAGIVHRDIRLSNVLFRQAGAPVLAGFGDAAFLDVAVSPASLAATPAVLDDRRQLVGVVRAVLALVDDPRAAALDLRLQSEPVTADDFCAALSDAVFALGEAQPVRLRQKDDTAAPVVRLVQPASSDDGGARSPALVRVPRRVRSSIRAGAARGWAAAVPLLDRARGVRRGVWAIAGGVSVCLVVALFAVPPAGGGSDSAAPGGTASPAPSLTEMPGAPTGDPVVLGDDPVAALPVLLAERARCVRDLSVLCLDAVLQPGSAAMDRDTAVIRALQSGGEQGPDDSVEVNSPALVQRLGDSALLDLGDVPQTQPASALMMRGEAGWRIRDYLDD